MALSEAGEVIKQLRDLQLQMKTLQDNTLFTINISVISGIIPSALRHGGRPSMAAVLNYQYLQQQFNTSRRYFREQMLEGPLGMKGLCTLLE